FLSLSGGSLSGNLEVTGTITATADITVNKVIADGSGLTALNADEITTGTLDNARLPTDISVTSLSGNVTGNGEGLTTLNATNITKGTLKNARLPASISVTNLSGNGAGLTALNADEITTGTINNDRLPADISVTNVSGTLSGDGAGLTELNADKITTGILKNEFLPATISGKTFSGNGASLTELNPAQLSTVIPFDKLPLANLQDIRNGDTTKITTAEQSQWLEQKIEALACSEFVTMSVSCAQTDSEIDFSNLPSSIDGITLNNNEYILLTAQTDKNKNRIWKVKKQGNELTLEASVVFTEDNLIQGLVIKIDGGSKHANKVFVLKGRYEITNMPVEYVWQHTANLLYTTEGLLQENNSLSVDFASTQNVLDGVIYKVVDAALLKNQLTNVESRVNAEMETKVDIEKLRIDNILLASNADKDSFTEIVTLINSVDTENDTAFANYVLSNNDRSLAIENAQSFEATTRANKDAEIETSLNGEISTRQQESEDRYTKAETSTMFLSLSGGSLSGNLEVTGTITATADITAFSDLRLKSNIENITNALNKVGQLNGVTFTRSDLNDGKRYTGVIAQEVQKVLPEAVKTENDLLSVAYGNMVGLLVESIKELSVKVNTLQNEIAALKQ
ncbi:MAG: tail fiber domain-containing protein, partial [Alteromonadaceae bacterium]|nr:tail fiber domain-containing protein [Alteromonadaceae bacterium]